MFIGRERRIGKNSFNKIFFLYTELKNSQIVLWICFMQGRKKLLKDDRKEEEEKNTNKKKNTNMKKQVLRMCVVVVVLSVVINLLK
jgi:Na+/melibiose symporter-like transporter